MAFNLGGGSSGGGRRTTSTLGEINIIPLVDVVLVLLLIFMLTAPLMYRGIDVNLPKTAGKPTVTEERMELTLTKDQQIYLNGKPLALGSLEQSLRETFKNRTDKTLYLKADQALQYGFVVETMDKVRKSGIEKLGMVTEPVRGHEHLERGSRNPHAVISPLGTPEDRADTSGARGAGQGAHRVRHRPPRGRGSVRGAGPLGYARSHNGARGEPLPLDRRRRHPCG